MPEYHNHKRELGKKSIGREREKAERASRSRLTRSEGRIEKLNHERW